MGAAEVLGVVGFLLAYECLRDVSHCFCRRNWCRKCSPREAVELVKHQNMWQKISDQDSRFQRNFWMLRMLLVLVALLRLGRNAMVSTP